MYADKATEQKLVNAIKEAAQRIDYSSTTDPEAILAECLLKQDLNEGFAKTAATALNKSYSVYYMSTHDDDTRGNDHPLLDSEKVKVHMCRESVPVCPKTSEPLEDDTDVEVKVITPSQKAASVIEAESHQRRQFKDTPEYLGWLAEGLTKAASGYSDLITDTNAALEAVYNRHNKLKSQDKDDYTVQCLYKQGNEDFNAYMDTLGCSRKYDSPVMFGTAKVASACPVVPINSTSRELCGLYRDALLVKTAAKSLAYLKDHLDDLNEGYQDTVKTYDYNCIMGKTAASPADAMGPTYGRALELGLSPVTMPMEALKGAIGGGFGALTNIAENSRIISELNRKGESDAKVIDPVLMTEDRRVKNLEAWSEVAADPDLARYPVTDLFEVTQKLIKANPQFERPDMAPMLVDTVAQVMSQGSRIGLALHGATAKTISDIAQGRTNVTGNDLYDIRSNITGRHEAGALLPGGVSSLFMGSFDKAREHGAAFEEALKQGIKDSVEAGRKGVVNLGVMLGQGIGQEGRDKLIKKLDSRLKIKELEKKLAPKTEEELRIEAEKKEIEDAKHNKALTEAQRKPTEEELERKQKSQRIADMEQDNKLNRLESEKARREIEASGLAEQIDILKNNPEKAEKLLNAMNMSNSNIALSSGKTTGYTGDVIRADNSKLDTSTLADTLKSLPNESSKDISISGSKVPSTPTIGVDDKDLAPTSSNKDQKNKPMPSGTTDRRKDNQAYTLDKLQKYLDGEILFSRGVYNDNSDAKRTSKDWVSSLGGKLVRPKNGEITDSQAKHNREVIANAVNMLRDWQKQGLLLDSGKRYNWQILRDIIRQYGDDTGYNQK